MHRLNITHDDLKPDNILLRRVTDGYEAVIIDLGEARRGGGCSFVVTPDDAERYPQLAPEILDGESTTLASDVYRWAINAYRAELVAGNIEMWICFPQFLSADIVQEVLIASHGRQSLVSPI